ncbi:ABC transporter ATP-binding protein [Plantactinospora sp. B6F1]|uniref:ABC transporter ATP-binding protein n=1 Tax=Plantactinospora sp. B6F1 TaxID=3158971 RepID=UPI0032D99DC3
MNPRRSAARSRGLVVRALGAGALTGRAAPGKLGLYAAITLVGGALPVATAWLTKLVLDNLIGGAALATLVALGSGLAAAGVLVSVLPQVGQYLRAELDRAAGMLAHDRLFRAVNGFVGLGRFEDPPFLDRLRLAQQAGGTSPNQAVDGLLGMARAAITITGFLASLFLLSPVMTTLVLLAGIPALIGELALAQRRARMLLEIVPAERREFFYRSLLSTVEAAKEVRLFGAGTFLRERMLADRRTAYTATRAVDRRTVLVQAGLGLMAAAVAGAGVLWAIRAARQGQLSIGDIAIFIAAVAGVQSALVTVAREMARTHQALLMFDHYLAVTTAGPELPLANAPRPLPPLRSGIEVRDLWFRYSEDQPWVLRGINLWIPHGKALALIGLNGTGKSTLVKLLCRFYDPTRGAILWDGSDIRHADVAELRRRVGAVFQDYMHYDLSARENITLGDPETGADESRIRAAAQRAGIHGRLAALPDGYDTLLSRMFATEPGQTPAGSGTLLSEGQWQRLALARALLRDQRDLLILDEPSAGLDAEAEHEIHTALRRHRAGRTTLLISHRLGAVRDADLIVVLADGDVVEEGNHDELMAVDGEYARLFRLQAAGYRDGADGYRAGTVSALVRTAERGP